MHVPTSRGNKKIYMSMWDVCWALPSPRLEHGRRPRLCAAKLGDGRVARPMRRSIARMLVAWHANRHHDRPLAFAEALCLGAKPKCGDVRFFAAIGSEA